MIPDKDYPHPLGLHISENREREELLNASHLIGKAMQLVWNDWCSDTGCVPDCIHIRGPKTTRVMGNFEYSNFVYQVAETLHALGYNVTPNEKGQR